MLCSFFLTKTIFLFFDSTAVTYDHKSFIFIELTTLQEANLDSNKNSLHELHYNKYFNI